MLNASERMPDQAASWEIDEAFALAYARLSMTARRERGQFFPHDLFGEPSFDILLDLFIAHCERKRISISSACIASGAAPTTALRWLNRLEKLGLVERVMDGHDRRRVFVQITRRCYDAMMGWVERVAPR